MPPGVWFRPSFSGMMRKPILESSPHVPRRYRQIEVTVEPNFMPERSSVEKREYFWSYTIVITNTGAETVATADAHWIITDASGRKQEMRGEGVVANSPCSRRASASNTPAACRCRPRRAS